MYNEVWYIMGGNCTKVMGYQNGQLVITIPKSLAQASNIIRGSYIEWFIDRGDLVLRKK